MNIIGLILTAALASCCADSAFAQTIQVSVGGVTYVVDPTTMRIDGAVKLSAEYSLPGRAHA